VAGVVVAVVVIAAAVAGGFFYMRRKRNQEIEEEHRRNAAVSAFIGNPPGSSSGTSMTDSRLDPVMAQRRMSDGSIADNQDYSRRILRVGLVRSLRCRRRIF
jgi:cell wall integrity and stress response component